MPIDLACPSCRRALQVPDYAAGKKARCPACGEVIPVPALQRTVNPYAAPTASTMAPPEDQEFSQPEGPLDIGRVWNEAWAAWSRNLGVLVGATVILFVISVAMVVGMWTAMFVTTAMPVQQGDLTPLIAFIAIVIVGSLLSWLVQSYLLIGLIRMGLDASRERPVIFSRLFSGGDVLVGWFGYSIVFQIMTMLGMYACLFPGLALAALFWPGLCAIADRRVKGLEAFGYSLRLVRGNFWNSLLLMLVLLGVHLLGILACGVGMLFSIPLQFVLLATAYRHMAGDPKPQHASDVLDPMSGQGGGGTDFA